MADKFGESTQAQSRSKNTNRGPSRFVIRSSGLPILYICEMKFDLGCAWKAHGKSPWSCVQSRSDNNGVEIKTEQPIRTRGNLKAMETLCGACLDGWILVICRHAYPGGPVAVALVCDGASSMEIGVWAETLSSPCTARDKHQTIPCDVLISFVRTSLSLSPSSLCAFAALVHPFLHTTAYTDPTLSSIATFCA